MRCRVPAFVLALLFLSFPAHAQQPKGSIVVFSPHPDDETLGCGCRIAEEAARGASVVVVFLTDGEAYLPAAAGRDPRSLGQERRREAKRAAGQLGISEKDLIFLGYPDTRLNVMWEQRSTETGRKILADIRRILSERSPSAVYVPSPIDNHSDHAAAAKLVLGALARGRAGNPLPKIFYYRVHVRPGEKPLPGEAQAAGPLSIEHKRRAMAEYHSQQATEKGCRDFGQMLARGEWITAVPDSAAGWEQYFSVQWKAAAAAMRSLGYSVNLAPVADIARDIDDSSADLVKKDRIYSDDPRTVETLTGLAADAMSGEGIVPVAKHFPGLGSVRLNTHQRLPVIRDTQEEIIASLSPYRSLIKKNSDCWIMTSHAVYPALDSLPASLSRRIQTGLLRETMGFGGLIISDELMNMQSLEEFCAQRGIAEPRIGELTVMAFDAGTDLALIYQRGNDAAGMVTGVIKAVKLALDQGRLSEKKLNESVARILREKEKIHKVPLAQLLKGMSLEQRIAQKLVIDVDSASSKVCPAFGLGGVVTREESAIASCLRDSKIPPFVICQHEGGWVKEEKLGVVTPSAYASGREFELASGEVLPARPAVAARAARPAAGAQWAVPGFSRMAPGQRKQMLALVSGTIADLRDFFNHTVRAGDGVTRNPDRYSPFGLDIASRQKLVLYPFDDMPFDWLKKFEDRNDALCAYGLIKDAFASASKGGTYLPGDNQVAALDALEQSAQKEESAQRPAPLRVLCIAAHPDDEDGEALEYFRKRFNAETILLYATRGEGGKNALKGGSRMNLGTVRTKEAQLAAMRLGVDTVYFLDKKDFGYCQDPEQAKSVWGSADTVEKLAYFVRLARPDVIVTKHALSDPSGQHRALLELAGQAFDAAADASRTVEGLAPWQAEAFYARGELPEDYPLADLAVNREEKAAQNMSIGALCAWAAAAHASQRASVSPKGTVYYRLYKVSRPTTVPSE